MYYQRVAISNNLNKSLLFSDGSSICKKGLLIFSSFPGHTSASQRAKGEAELQWSFQNGILRKLCKHLKSWIPVPKIRSITKIDYCIIIGRTPLFDYYINHGEQNFFWKISRSINFHGIFLGIFTLFWNSKILIPRENISKKNREFDFIRLFRP